MSKNKHVAVGMRISHALQRHIMGVGTITTGSQVLMIFGLAVLKRDLRSLVPTMWYLLGQREDFTSQVAYDMLWKLANEWLDKETDATARKIAYPDCFTPAQWRALCERYGYRCLACGEQRPLTPDHVIPTAHGGEVGIDNIQPLCLECNQRKGTKIIDYRSKYEGDS